ncbi:MAG: NAD(P)-dependent alcohol dehydrogenase [Nitrososphaerales archaeon]
MSHKATNQSGEIMGFNAEFARTRSSMKIQAAVLHQPNEKIRIETVDLAEPKHDELLVKIVACGVCHTDAVQIKGAGYYPIVLGHEASGIVEAISDGVTDFQIGDHVVLSYNSCGECEACKDDRPFDCEHFRHLQFRGLRLDATSPLSINGRTVATFFGQGGFATYSVCSVRNAVKIDPKLDLRMMAPLGCGVQTGAASVLIYCKPKPNESIAIFGAGSVGLSAILAAKVAGCSPIIAVDLIESRLELAREFGATHVINAKTTPDILAALRGITESLQYVLDTSGNQHLLDVGVEVLGENGKGGQVARGGEVHLSDRDIEMGKTWIHLVEGRAVPQMFIPQMIELWRKGRFPFDRMITYFVFSKVNEAFEASRNGTVVKPVLIMS